MAIQITKLLDDAYKTLNGIKDTVNNICNHHHNNNLELDLENNKELENPNINTEMKE